MNANGTLELHSNWKQIRSLTEGKIPRWDYEHKTKRLGNNFCTGKHCYQWKSSLSIKIQYNISDAFSGVGEISEMESNGLYYHITISPFCLPSTFLKTSMRYSETWLQFLSAATHQWIRNWNFVTEIHAVTEKIKQFGIIRKHTSFKTYIYWQKKYLVFHWQKLLWLHGK